MLGVSMQLEQFPVLATRGNRRPSSTKRGCRKEPAHDELEIAAGFLSFIQDQAIAGEITWSGGMGIAALAEWYADEEGIDLPPMNRFAHALSRITTKRIKKVGKQWPTVYVIPRKKRLAA